MIKLNLVRSKLTFSPTVFLHCLNHDDEEESKEVEAFADVRTGNLEEVVLVELLEHAALQLHELERNQEID